MSTNISAISDNSFESEVIQSNLPVLVDFWATGAAPVKPLHLFWKILRRNMRAK